MKSENRLPITPQTKVGELLEAYPELEDILIDIAPPFRKLRNPVLRRTVARVTSLAQAARVGNVSVEAMVRRLREAVGQTGPIEEAVAGHDEVAAERPAWFDGARIVERLDARPLIEAGEQPVGRVLGALKTLRQDAIYELIAPFEPAPLIDKARQLGYEVWTTTATTGEYHTYFRGK